MPINRSIESTLNEEIGKGKVIVLLGPRQVGKTTLLQKLSHASASQTLWLDAENADVPPLFERPTATGLKNLIGNHSVVMIDEAQKIPNIGQVLKLLADYAPGIQVVASGSSSFELRNSTSEALTGRKWEHLLLPLSFEELAHHHTLMEEKRNLHHRLVYGSYPDVVTSPGEERKRLQLLAESYLYKDILIWGGLKKPGKLVDLLKALSLQLGNEVSYNELGNLVGLKSDTVENYIQLLEQAYIVYRLPAFSGNHRKELRRGRKVYFYDNGIRNAVIGDYRPAAVRQDIGSLWENWVISELFKQQHYHIGYGQFYFWRTQDQQEIDLIIDRDGQLNAYEIKWNSRAKVRLSKSFSNTYPNHSFQVIHPDNYDMVLMAEGSGRHL